jgi:PmbA protein
MSIPNERTAQATEMAQIVVDALTDTPEADAWQTTTIAEEQTQLYVIGEQIESRRDVRDARVEVVLHNTHEPHSPDSAGPVSGSSGVTLLSTDIADTATLYARLNYAATIASLTDNQPYALPGLSAEGFPTVATADPELAGDMRAAVASAMNRLRAAVASWSSVRLSSAELYATRAQRSLRNSRGLVGHSQGTHVFLDFVVIAREDDREAEFHAELERRRLADLMIEGTVDAYASFARHSLYARQPATVTGPVILSGAALPEFFGPIVFNTSARAQYQKVSRVKPGEYLCGEEPRGDRLTLISDARRPYGLRSAPFDREGIPAQTVPIVAQGIYTHPWADARYAIYLGVTPTGSFANLTVTPGSWSLDDLRSTESGPIYEIVAFSWFNPDEISGDFACEIKLGYRHDAHGTTPIKGGSLSGNVFTALADARLSRETYSDGYYLGPAAIRFASLSIAGE